MQQHRTLWFPEIVIKNYFVISFLLVSMWNMLQARMYIP